MEPRARGAPFCTYNGRMVTTGCGLARVARIQGASEGGTGSIHEGCASITARRARETGHRDREGKQADGERGGLMVGEGERGGLSKIAGE